MIKKIFSGNKLDLLFELTKTSFILKYNGSLLGFIWVILKPFLQFLILYFVFSQFASNAQLENFVVYLLIGIIFFTFINEAVVTGVQGLLSKGSIILKVNFDRSLVIYSNLLLAVINLIINLLILLVFVIFNPVQINFVSFIYAVGVMTIVLLFLSGFSFILSIITVRIRDMQHIMEVLLSLLFYASPIIYQIEDIPEEYKLFIEYNPITILLQAFRNAIMYGQESYLNEIILLGSMSLVVFIGGFLFFKNKVKKVAEYF